MSHKPAQRLTIDQERALYGFGQSSPLNWGKVIRFQLERIEGHQQHLVDMLSTPSPDGMPPQLNGQWAEIEIAWRIRTDAHFLILALRHLQRFGPIYARIMDRDSRVRAAIAKFDAEFPGIKDIRDGLEHRDQRVRRQATAENLAPQVLGDVQAADDSPTGELAYIFEGQVLALKAAAHAGIALADGLDEIWQEKVFGGKKIIAESFSRASTV